MGQPGPPGEKLSNTQLSGARAALHHALADVIPGPEDSDLVPSLTLAAALVLLFLLLSVCLYLSTHPTIYTVSQIFEQGQADIHILSNITSPVSELSLPRDK